MTTNTNAAIDAASAQAKEGGACMSAPMNMQQLGALIKHIREHHSPDTCGVNGKVIKYFHPNIDMRDGKCFSVRLRGYGWEELIHTQNECRDLPESLYQRVLAFLEAPHAR